MVFVLCTRKVGDRWGARKREKGGKFGGGKGWSVDGDGYVFFKETFIASQLARENRGPDHLWTESRRKFNIMKGELKTPGPGRLAEGEWDPREPARAGKGNWELGMGLTGRGDGDRDGETGTGAWNEQAKGQSAGWTHARAGEHLGMEMETIH